jgi:hypothetical protein
MAPKKKTTRRKQAGKPPAAMDRALARQRAGMLTPNIVDLVHLIETAMTAASRLAMMTSAETEKELATAAAEVLDALQCGLRGRDALLDDLHGVAMKALAKAPIWQDTHRARYRLKKGGRANLRDQALKITGVVKGSGALDEAEAEILATLVGNLAGRRVTAREIVTAFQKGWHADRDLNAEQLLVVALGSEKAARNAMHAANDMAARRRSKKSPG